VRILIIGCQLILSKLFPFHDITASTPDEIRSKMAQLSIEKTMDDMRPKI